jgi:hypothetical protein
MKISKLIPGLAFTAAVICILPAQGAKQMAVPSGKLHGEQRQLWHAHVALTRAWILQDVANKPSAKPTLQRLLQNQVDIGNAFKRYYGEAAGNRLLREAFRAPPNCLIVYGVVGLLLVRRYILPKLRIQDADSGFCRAIQGSVMVFHGLAIALIVVTCGRTIPTSPRACRKKLPQPQLSIASSAMIGLWSPFLKRAFEIGSLSRT